ncbi:PEPxxWA-CTERM sorting domain-containing protein [uncultured Sphingomonas sp.]|uniref:Npun_F0296 family exosortase-dependent surface protein n=1 Tax=uncultured Sphingomonas sp. TaxID=158754 RepID=UPI0035CA1F34
MLSAVGSAPAGFSLSGSGYAVASGNISGQRAAPAFSDSSRYLAVGAGGTATLVSALAYSSVSIFLGSIDSFNTVQILTGAGTVLQTFTGAQFTADANGNQSLPSTNRRITFKAAAGETISGIRFLSSRPALEVDNVVFAVPEPSTWMMMLIGFGLVGQAMRSRRRSNVRVVYA